MGIQIPHGKRQFWGGNGRTTVRFRDTLRLSVHWINGWTDRFAVLVVDSGRPKEAQVQSYSPVAPMCSHCHWTVHVWRRCGLLSNYFDHLLLLVLHWSINSEAAAVVVTGLTQGAQNNVPPPPPPPSSLWMNSQSSQQPHQYRAPAPPWQQPQRGRGNMTQTGFPSLPPPPPPPSAPYRSSGGRGGFTGSRY